MNNKFKSYFMVGGFIVALVIGFFVTPWPIQDEVVEISEEVEQDSNTNTDCIYVYVLGAVKEPGVITVTKDARLYEVINLAGGVTEDADVQKINLASVVKDEEKIIVPFLISR